MRKKKGVTIKPTMNIIERKITAGAIYQNAVKIGEKILAWVPVELLNIQSYQRDRQRYAASIAENWDDTKCDVLKVSYDKENGWFNIIDGQHRAAAAKMRGIEYLVCEILTGLTESRESTIYVEENTTSKKLSPFDTYKANQYINGADKTRYSDTDKRIKATPHNSDGVVAPSDFSSNDTNRRGLVLAVLPRRFVKFDGKDASKCTIKALAANCAVLP